MTAIEFAGLLVGSSVFAAIVTQGGGLLLERLRHKNAKEDKAAEKDNAVMDKLNEIDGKLTKHIESDARRWADTARTQILRFGGELKRGIKFSQEAWSQILETIDNYNDFCVLNPEYPNTKAVSTIEYIKGKYQECLEHNDFL